MAGEDDPHRARYRIHVGYTGEDGRKAGRNRVMTPFGRALRLVRGLRFRLALSYVFFFTILLVMLGLVFRQTLSRTFEAEISNVLDEEWGAAKGYLRTGDSGPDWFYDKNDPDESFVVARATRVYMLADTQGHRLQNSVIYDSIGIDKPAE